VSERGTVTLWLLGLALGCLLVGGLAVDLARAVSTRQALASAADAAALAGAGGLDVGRYRRDGVIALDPGSAADRARAAFAAVTDRAVDARMTVAADDRAVRVEVTGTVGLTLLRLVRGATPFTVRVTAVARPHRLP